MTTYSSARLTAALMGLLATSALTLQPASANYPHLVGPGVDCTDCHWAHGGGIWPDDTTCLVCHDGLFAPEVVGHSSQTTSDQYGMWSIPCLD
jgi:hypothetical protein